jgi:hypothetical protein
MVALPDAKLSPYISTKEPPNDGPVDGEILENIGDDDISKMSWRDPSNVEEQNNETWNDPTSFTAIKQEARSELLNNAGKVEINKPDMLETLHE